MSNVKTGGTAFPAIKIVAGDNYNRPTQYHLPGMSLRDYFAAKAMQAFIAGISNVGGVIPCNDERVSERAYNIADAMLKARGQS